jgi:PIN domain nuclease of toxin-antitoxin system
VGLLLDTHVLIWWTEDNPRLGRRTGAILDEQTEPWISAVSIWEVSIKTAARKLHLKVPFQEGMMHLISKGARPLPITFDHAYTVRHLPLRHAEPFDRMLVAQAQCEGLTIVTADPAFRAYPVGVLDAST